ncbi:MULTISPECIES: DUF2383 domain-containing protein [Methylomonas]|uniref:Uncharacterized protein n=2 Tax=Methylomonas TaxID=416 RepID=A0A126T8Y5_9GAMM|nr:MULTISPECIES: DUF2383 domain-containing protein [Methylomonas]AMK78559.1 hypothetical protein JT25_019030 [Methylomonas denitrificans]OAI06469.1 hypothetical protein A1342_06550 [Methylomonas methanica]TCV77393.1 uncharacterized protein DUF2383 [Methylomonas methanica]
MHNIEMIDSLLIDELAATETYSQVLKKLREEVSLGESDLLLPIYEAHKAAVSSLQTQIRELGGTPAKDSGVWGSWASLIQGGANVFGKQAALKVLQEGEKSGLGDYEKALLDQKLGSNIRTLILLKLLPAQHAHIDTLNQMMSSIAA